MRQKSNSTPASSETLVRNIRRATRKHHAAEEKIRIVLDGLRGETKIGQHPSGPSPGTSTSGNSIRRQP